MAKLGKQYEDIIPDYGNWNYVDTVKAKEEAERFAVLFEGLEDSNNLNFFRQAKKTGLSEGLIWRFISECRFKPLKEVVAKWTERAIKGEISRDIIKVLALTYLKKKYAFKKGDIVRNKITGELNEIVAENPVPDNPNIKFMVKSIVQDNLDYINSDNEQNWELVEDKKVIQSVLKFKLDKIASKKKEIVKDLICSIVSDDQLNVNEEMIEQAVSDLKDGLVQNDVLIPNAEKIIRHYFNRILNSEQVKHQLEDNQGESF